MEQEYYQNNIWPIEKNLEFCRDTMKPDYRMKQEECLQILQTRQEWIQNRCLEMCREKAGIIGQGGRPKADFEPRLN